MSARFPLAALALALALPVSAAKLPALVDVAPQDAAAVFFADLGAMKGSPLAARVLRSGTNITCEADADGMLRDLGIDPTKDIDRVLISVRPAERAGGEPELLFVAEGRFDAARIGKTLAGRGATPQPSAGGTLYRLSTLKLDGKSAAESHGRSDDRLVVAVPSSSRLVAGSDAEVVRALSGTGGSPFAAGRPLAAIVPLTRTGSAAWFVLDVDRFASAVERQRAAGSQGDAVAQAIGSLSSVNAIGGSLDLGRAVDLQLSARTDTEENAELVEDSIRGLLALWRLAVQEKAPDAVAALRKFRVERSGTTTTMSGALSRTDVDRLVTGAAAAARGHGADGN